MLEILEKLLAQFPAKHWKLWQQEFGHDFFELHGPRTAWYDEVLGGKIKGKRILEVGGFPGLLASWLLHRKCSVTTIEHPSWVPDWYMEWREGKYPFWIHDITTGAPTHIADQATWEWATMSDVLLHLNGFPTAFMQWLVERCDNIMLCQYPGDGSTIQPCMGGSLKHVFSTPHREVLIERMQVLGAELDQSWLGHDRELFHFVSIKRGLNANA